MRTKEYHFQFLPRLRRKEARGTNGMDLSRLRQSKHHFQILSRLRA